MTETRDPYLELGLESGADPDRVRARYLELVQAHPPDREPERFAAIQAAYEALRDPETRVENQLFEPDRGEGETLETLIREQIDRLTHRRLPTEALLALGEEEA